MDIDETIGKYLNNSATKEEKEILLVWLEAKEENRNKFKEMYDLWLYSNALLTDNKDMEAALARLNERTSLASKRTVSVRLFSFHVMRVAAAILLLFSAGYVGYYLKGNEEETVITMNKLLTGDNNKGQYVLPDGSTVWLNANSVLEYPDTFTGKKRMVRLKGEALFEVKKDTSNPFVVQTGGMDIEVLGTCFLVQNYPDKPTVETVLVNGSVKIEGNYFPESRILVPGQMIAYNKNTAKTDLSMVDTADYTNWIHSKLVFDKTNLAHVIINLEKWYGIRIVASPELVQNTHMSFTVRRESLEEILKYMSLTAPIAYKWKDNVLYLSSKE